MSVQRFKKIFVEDANINQIQENIEQVLEPFIINPILNGVLIKEVNIVSGTTTNIEHKLGRKPLGWIVTRKRADSRVWDLNDTNTAQDKTLSLTCSSNVKIDLWIF